MVIDSALSGEGVFDSCKFQWKIAELFVGCIGKMVMMVPSVCEKLGIPPEITEFFTPHDNVYECTYNCSWFSVVGLSPGRARELRDRCWEEACQKIQGE